MFTSIVDGISTISLARTDGSGLRSLDVGFAAIHPDYRPPDGAEIVFAGHDGPISGLYAIRPDSTGLRTIVKPTDMVLITFAGHRTDPGLPTPHGVRTLAPTIRLGST